MKNLCFLFVSTFLLSCSLYTDDFPPYSSYPDGFVKLLGIDSRIIDIEKEQVNTKEELLTYFDTTKNRRYIIPAPGSYPHEMRSHFFSYYLSLSISGEIDTSIYEYVVYVKPLSKNKPVLDINIYPFGMPVFVEPDILYWINRDSEWLEYRYRSNQRILLIKGNPEFWADSSYEHNGEKFTILPVCGNLENDMSQLRFTYTVKKVKKPEVYNEN